MNRSDVKFACLLILPAAMVLIMGCQRQSVSTAEQAAKTNQVILNYNKQASDAFAHNDLETARKMYFLASQQPGGEKLLETARAFQGLGFIENSRGQFDQASQDFQRAISICDLPAEATSDPYLAREKGSRRMAATGSLQGLAYAEVCQHKYDQAIKDLKRVISIFEAPPEGVTNPYLVGPLVSLAEVYQSKHQDEDAKVALIRAVQIGFPCGPYVSKDDYARALVDLGTIYLKNNQMLEAEAVLRRALDVSRSGAGPNGPQAQNIIESLATVLDKQGRTQDAMMLRRRHA